jgi:hypothetical protein
MTVQTGCEFDWDGGRYFTDTWLPVRVASPGTFALAPGSRIAPARDGAVQLVYRLADETGAGLPEKVDVDVPGEELRVMQDSREEGDGARRYTVWILKKDQDSGGFYTVTTTAGPMFPPIPTAIAFSRPGHSPAARVPARGRLLNGSFEDFGPESGFEGWHGPPNNWHAPDVAGVPPAGGGRMIEKAWCRTKGAFENHQVVLFPDTLGAGTTVTASAWLKGIAPAEATDHEAVRFRLSIAFEDAGGRELLRSDSPLVTGTGQWEKLVFTTPGAPEGSARAKFIVFHENTNADGWHMAFIDSAEIEFHGPE